MNIYESVYQQNAKHPGKCALSITMNDGTRRMYTYGEVFQLAETYARHLTDAGVRAGRPCRVCGGGQPRVDDCLFRRLQAALYRGAH